MKKHQDIEAVDLFNMLKSQSIALIDVRNDDEVARGIIPGANYVTLSLIPTLDVSQIENKTFVFYCQSVIRSGQAAAFVAGQIDASIYNLRGGILAWGSAGFDFASL